LPLQRLPPATTIVVTTIITTRTPKMNPGPKQHDRWAGTNFFVLSGTDQQTKSC